MPLPVAVFSVIPKWMGIASTCSQPSLQVKRHQAPVAPPLPYLYVRSLKIASNTEGKGCKFDGSTQKLRIVTATGQIRQDGPGGPLGKLPIDTPPQSRYQPVAQVRVSAMVVAEVPCLRRGLIFASVAGRPYAAYYGALGCFSTECCEHIAARLVKDWPGVENDSRTIGAAV